VLRDGASFVQRQHIVKRAALGQTLTRHRFERHADNPPKTARPVGKRKLVDGIYSERDVSIRRACRVLEMDTSSDHFKSRRPLRMPALKAGSKRLVKRVSVMATGM
jgi:hypothetical protein